MTDLGLCGFWIYDVSVRFFGELGGMMECVGAAEKQCEQEKATEMGSVLSDSSVREDYAM